MCIITRTDCVAHVSPACSGRGREVVIDCDFAQARGRLCGVQVQVITRTCEACAGIERLQQLMQREAPARPTLPPTEGPIYETCRHGVAHLTGTWDAWQAAKINSGADAWDEIDRRAIEYGAWYRGQDPGTRVTVRLPARTSVFSRKGEWLPRPPPAEEWYECPRCHSQFISRHELETHRTQCGVRWRY